MHRMGCKRGDPRLLGGPVGWRLLSSLLVVLAGCSAGLGESVPEGGEPTFPPYEPGVLHYVGDLSVEQDGAVLRGLDIGCLRVHASDVLVEHSRVRCGANTAVRVMSGAQGLVVRDTEIDGMDRASVGVGPAHFHLQRVDVHSSSDGVRAGTSVTVEDSRIHDLFRSEGSHNDGIQITQGSGIVIRGNTIDVRSGQDYMNAAVIISAKGPQPVGDVLIEGNTLDGGNWTMSLGAEGEFPVSGIVVRGNTIGGRHRYGIAAAVPEGTVWKQNRYPDGSAVAAP